MKEGQKRGERSDKGREGRKVMRGEKRQKRRREGIKEGDRSDKRGERSDKRGEKR